MFDVIQLPLEERIKTGCSHMAIIDFAKLAETDAATVTLDLFTYAARDIVDRWFLDLVTPFDGGATSALKLDFGYNGTSVDDADAFIDNTEIHADGTEILADVGTVAAPATDTVDATYGTEESTVIGSLRTQLNLLLAKRPFAAQEAGVLEAVFTATGGDLDLLTTGRAHLFFNVIRPTEVRPINL